MYVYGYMLRFSVFCSTGARAICTQSKGFWCRGGVYDVRATGAVILVQELTVSHATGAVILVQELTVSHATGAVILVQELTVSHATGAGLSVTMAT